MSTRTTWKFVRDEIHGKILNSTYLPGDKLPKDEDIANELGCARTTVQRAMQDLSDSGILQRKRKGGTHVRSDPVTRATLEISIIRKEVERRGSVYGYQLISRTLAKTPFSIMAKFGISAPAKMLRIEALHLADQRPYIYEDRWVSTETVPEIVNLDLAKHSANEWLVHNKPYSKCNICFSALKASKYHAELLDTQANDALFVLERTTWINDQPITTVKAVAGPGYQLQARI